MNKSNLVQALPELVEELKSININILKGRLDRGNILTRIKDQKAYINYDSYCETWDQFLEAVGINRETARQDMQICKEFSQYLLGRLDLLQNCSYERLVRLLPVAKQKPELKSSLLDMAASANRTDFDNNLREIKGKMPSDNCLSLETCEDKRTIILEKCTICGLTFRRKDLEYA
jgi:hypothetical protein